MTITPEAMFHIYKQNISLVECVDHHKTLEENFLSWKHFGMENHPSRLISNVHSLIQLNGHGVVKQLVCTEELYLIFAILCNIESCIITMITV